MRATVRQLIFFFFYYLFLVLFIIGIWSINIAAILITLFLRGEKVRPILSQLIYGSTKFYVFCLTKTGMLICDFDAIDELRNAKGKIIIANHPSILDAVILLSRLPNVICIFKSSLTRFVLHPKAAKALNYLSNNGGLDLIKEIIEKAHQNESILIFPEGTRTSGEVINSLNSGYALAALKSGVSIELLSIHSNSSLLSKKGHFMKPIDFPAVFDIKRGPTVDPKNFKTVNQITSHVENWYHKNLSHQHCDKTLYLPIEHNRELIENGFIYYFCVPKNPCYCNGHMPGNPITPAYVQLSWVHEILIKETQRPIQVIDHFNWKFLNPILPLHSISAKFDLASNGWRITLSNNNRIVSKGRTRISHE